MTAARTAHDMSDESLLAAVTDEFMERLARGEKPDVEDYARRHPAIGPVLRQVLPALQMLRGAPSGDEGPAGDSEEPLGVLGDFRILREIGRGGMGLVYEAEQVSLGRRVALKVLPFASTLDQRQLQRFKHEAQAAAHLHHTNIVPVYAVGTERGVHFYAMQFIDGHNIADVIRQLRELDAGQGKRTRKRRRGDDATGPYTPSADDRPASASTHAQAVLSTHRSQRDPAYIRSAVRLAQQAAEALEHAHNQGVIHRDIKPANLMVDGAGNLWVTDFGLAHVQSDAGLTMTGDLVGTVRYMSPEQALAKRVVIDHRTDIYSLGVTLYELLTLEPAFAGDDRQELVRQVAFEEPRPPRRLNRAVPVELETIVLKAMAKNPAERYATAQELADDLGRWLEDRPIRARKPSLTQRVARWGRRHKGLVAGGVVVLLIAVVALAVSNLFVWKAQRRAQAAYEAEARQRKIARQAVDDMFTRVAEKWLEDEAGLEDVQREFLEKAAAYYEEFARDDGTDPEVRFGAAEANRRVGDVHRKLGSAAKAEPAYDRAIALLEGMVATSPNQPDYQEALGRTYNSRGRLLEGTGRVDQHEKDMRRALGLREKLVQDHPDVPRYRHQLAMSAYNLSLVLDDKGQTAAARNSLQRAIDLLERLVEEVPGEPEYRHIRAASIAELARSVANTDPRKADELSRRAIDLQQQLADEFPRVALYRCWLALILNNHGAVLGTLGRNADRVQAYRQSLGLRTKLADDFPGVSAYRRDVASGMMNLGSSLGNMGRTGEGDARLREAQDRLQKLVQDYPNDLTSRAYLATVHINLALSCTTARAGPEAEGHFNEALSLCDRLVADAPSSVAYKAQRAEVLWRRGLAQIDQGHLEEAEAALRRAVDLNQQLASDVPALPLLQDQLLRSREGLARVLGQRGRAQEGETLLRQSVELRQRLIKDYPGMPGYRDALARAYTNLAQVVDRNGRAREAEAFFRESIKAAEEAVQAAPDMLYFRDTLAGNIGNFGPFLLRADKREEADRLCRRGLELAQRLVEAAPDVPAYRSQFANLRWLHGDVWQAAENWHEAETAWRQSLTLSEKLVADVPAEPEYRQYLAARHGGLGEQLGKRREWPQAESAIRRSLDLFQALVREYPDRPAYVSYLAWSWRRQGDLMSRADRLPEAARAYRAARELLERLVLDHPIRSLYARELFGAQQKLADFHRDNREFSDAARVYRDAHAFWQRLGIEHPSETYYRADSASSLNGVGMALTGARHWEEAEQAYRDSLAAWEKGLAEFGTSEGAATNLAIVTYNLGVLFRDSRRQAEAEAAYRKAVAGLEQFVDGHPGASESCSRLELLYRELADFLAGCHRGDDAIAVYRQALAFWQRLAAARPGTAKLRDCEALSRERLGVALVSARRWQEAEDAYRATREAWEEAAAETPDNATYALNVPILTGRLASLARQQTRWDEAEQLYRCAIEQSEGALKRFSNVRLRRELASSYYYLGVLLRDCGKPQEAEAALRQGLAVWEKLVVGFTDERYDRLNLAWTLLQLGDHPAVMKQVAELRRISPRNATSLSDLFGLLQNAYWQAHTDASLSAAKRSELVEQYAGEARDVLQRLHALDPKDAPNGNLLAWFLASTPHTPFRDAARAVALARDVVEADPDKWYYWHTLGFALYLAGDGKAAIVALEKGQALHDGGEAIDWYSLALAHAQCGNKEAAVKSFDQAEEWVAVNKSSDPLLKGLRAEAAAVMERSKGKP
jgi:serine/threonine protein kinase